MNRKLEILCAVLLCIICAAVGGAIGLRLGLYASSDLTEMRESARPAPAAAKVIHKMDRRLSDQAAFFRCTNERHDYAVESMRYEWKDVTCPKCLALQERGPAVPPVDATTQTR